MNVTMRNKWWSLSGLVAVMLPLLVSGVASAQEAAGFNGYIQSGTCAAPTEALRVNLDSGGAHAVEPYRANQGDQTIVLGYYGSPHAPGFGLSVIYTDQKFSLAITDVENGRLVACGDILRPVADEFGEAGVAVVQLLPVEDSGVQGVAAIQRTQLQRELDVTPTRVRVLLSTEAPTSPPPQAAAGYDGLIQAGSCQAPTGRVRVELQGRADRDVNPYLAQADSGNPVTLAYYGAPGAPGFGLASSYAGQQFSLAVTGEGGEPAACGDILRPSSANFVEAGLALVQLQPVENSGVQGYALIERTELQRELDVTPTRVRIVIFAPPAVSQ